ncbi:MAG: FlgD immunoglobulin-like domain containing protein [Elusimicrobiales bacterium]|nr:FlgD immunoglobulin-like domain containing protein [Elusimicrobiales bacterium]
MNRLIAAAALLLCLRPAWGQTEIGDLVYRNLSLPINEHNAVYVNYVEPSTAQAANPADLTKHSVIQMTGVTSFDGSGVVTAVSGIEKITFQKFQTDGTYIGAYTSTTTIPRNYSSGYQWTMSRMAILNAANRMSTRAVPIIYVIGVGDNIATLATSYMTVDGSGSAIYESNIISMRSDAFTEFVYAETGFPIMDVNASTYAGLAILKTRASNLQLFPSTQRARLAAATITLPSATMYDDKGAVLPDGGTSTTTLTVQITAADSLSGPGRIEVYKDGALVGVNSGFSSGTTYADVSTRTFTTTLLPNGAYSIKVFDQAGNTSVKTLTVNRPPPSISSITPAVGSNKGSTSITNLAGAGFLTGAAVKLSRTGEGDVIASNVSVADSGRITCSLALSTAAAGAWNVTVTNADGQSAALANAFTIVAVTPLSPHAVSVSSGALSFGWDSVADASYVAALASDSGYTNIVSSGLVSGAASASFEGLSANTLYYFTVKLSTETDTAYAANTASARTLANTPLSPSLGSVTQTGMTASWTYVPGANYITVLSTASDYTGIVSSGTVASPAHSRVFSTLDSYATYYFEVKISTETDAAYPANRAAAQTLAYTTPLSPAFTAVSTSSLTAAWTASAFGASYVAVLAADADYSVIVSSAQVAGINYKTFPGLSPNTMYYFTVKVSTEVNVSYAINRASARTSASTPLAPALSSITSSGMTASWTAVAGAAGYIAVLASDPAYTSIVSSAAITASSATFTGLAAQTAYYFQVKLSTETDAAFPANRTSAQTLSSRTPLAPALGSVGSYGMTASWNASPGASYIAVLASNAGYTGIVSSSTVSGNSKTFAGLAALTTYYFEVKIATETDAAYPYNRTAARTLAPHTPLAPEFTSVSAFGLTARWTAAAGARYVAVLSLFNYATIVSSATVNSNSAAFTGLSPSTPYYFEVKLSTETDTAYLDNRINTQTPPARTALSPVFNPVYFSSMTASWTAVSGSTYVVVLAYDSGFKNIVSSAAAGASSITFTDLFPGRAYSFEVKLSTETDAAYELNRVSVNTASHVAMAKIFHGIFKPRLGETAQITVGLNAPGHLTVKIYDPDGRFVRTVFDGYRSETPGSDYWDGKNQDGATVASGIYFVRIEGPGLQLTKRVLVVK